MRETDACVREAPPPIPEPAADSRVCNSNGGLSHDLGAVRADGSPLPPIAKPERQSVPARAIQGDDGTAADERIWGLAAKIAACWPSAAAPDRTRLALETIVRRAMAGGRRWPPKAPSRIDELLDLIDSRVNHWASHYAALKAERNGRQPLGAPNWIADMVWLGEPPAIAIARQSNLALDVLDRIAKGEKFA